MRKMRSPTTQEEFEGGGGVFTREAMGSPCCLPGVRDRRRRTLFEDFREKLLDDHHVQMHLLLAFFRDVFALHHEDDEEDKDNEEAYTHTHTHTHTHIPQLAKSTKRQKADVLEGWHLANG
jgi:hypothetical protein